MNSRVFHISNSIKTSLIILFCCLSTTIYSQELKPYAYHLDEFLNVPQGNIYEIIEDKDALKWIATSTGLYLLEADEFILHKADKQKGQSVFDPVIDCDNNIWFTNLYGQILKTSRGSQVEIVTDLGGTSNGFIPLLYSDDNAVYVTLRDKLLIYRNENEPITVSYLDKGFPITNLYPSGDKLVCLKGKTLFELNERYELVKVDELPVFKSTGSTTLFSNNNELIFVFSNDQGAHFYNITKQRLENLFFEDLAGLSILNIKNFKNEVHFDTSSGIFIYDISSTPQLINRLLEDRVTTSHFYDFNNALWVSTYRDGVYILYPELIQEYIFEEGDQVINSFEPDKKGGAHVIRNEDKLYYSHTDNKTFEIPGKRRADIQLFTNSRDSSLLLHNANLYKVDDTGFIKETEIRGLKDLDFYQNYEFLSTYNELSKTLGFTKKIKSVKGRTNFAVIGKKTILAMNNGYVRFFDLDLNPLSNLQENSEKIILKYAVQLKDNSFIGLNLDGELLKISLRNKIPVLTSWDLEKVSALQGNFKQIRSNANHIYALTNQGILKYDIKKQKSYFSGAYNSIPWNSITDFKIDNNSIWLQERKRLFKFDDRLFNQEQKTLRLSIDRISTLEREHDIKNTINLKPDNNGVIVKTSINGLIETTGFDLEYRLSQAGAWTKTFTDNGSSILPRFKAGSHLLELRKKHPLTGSETSIITLNVEVDQVFYKKPWIIVSAVMILLSFGYLIYDYRGKFVSKKMTEQIKAAQLENQLNQLKLENLRSQMNPHFIFNSLNSIQDFIMSNDRKLASKFLVRFSRLMRLYLNHSQKTNITLKQELEALNLYLELEYERFNCDFQYEIDVANDIEIRTLMVPSLFLQPYVENCLNHGLHHKKGFKNLKILINQKDAQLRIEIKDNGIGRAASQELNVNLKHESFSTKANQSRIKLMKEYHGNQLKIDIEDLYDNNGKAIGTSVTLVLPLITKS